MAELSVEGLRVHAGRAMLVSDVSFTVRTGQVVALVGESGAGKSVMLRSLLGLEGLRPGRTAGTLRLDGVELPPAALRGRVGMIFQDGRASLDPLRTVGEALAHAARLAGATVAGAEALERLGFPDPLAALTRYPHELSGGMAQRAALGVALAGRPRFLFCDEPTTGLDAPVKVELLRLLRGLTDVGVLFVTHDLRLLDGFADEVLVLEGGALVERAPRLGLLRGAGLRLVEATRPIAPEGWPA